MWMKERFLPGHGNNSQAIETQMLPPLELSPGRSGPVVEGVPGLGGLVTTEERWGLLWETGPHVVERPS